MEIADVTKSYRRPFRISQPVLEGFCATLPVGIHALLGPNGAGKTTLLRIVAGILSPGSGTVLLDGRPIRDLDASYRQLLGYVPQNFGYYRNFTVVRFLSYLAELKCVPLAQRGARIEKVLAQTGLTQRRDEKIRRLSGGLRQRLGIAQALLNDPRILILDEPTVGLDPAERMRFKEVLSSLSRRAIILLSTHIVSDIEDLADDILLLSGGRCLMQGPPHALLDSLSGCVWLTDHAITSVGPEAVTVLSERLDSGRRIRRVFCRSKPAPDAKPASATLDDLYMLHFEVGTNDGNLD